MKVSGMPLSRLKVIASKMLVLLSLASPWYMRSGSWAGQLLMVPVLCSIAKCCIPAADGAM